MGKSKESNSEDAIARVSSTNDEIDLRYQWEPVSWLLSGNESERAKPVESVNLLSNARV